MYTNYYLVIRATYWKNELSVSFISVTYLKVFRSDAFLAICGKSPQWIARSSCQVTLIFLRFQVQVECVSIIKYISQYRFVWKYIQCVSRYDMQITDMAHSTDCSRCAKNLELAILLSLCRHLIDPLYCTDLIRYLQILLQRNKPLNFFFLHDMFSRSKLVFTRRESTNSNCSLICEQWFCVTAVSLSQ